MAFGGMWVVPGFDFDRHVVRSIADWPALLEFFEVFDDALGQYNLSTRPAGSDVTGVVFRPRFAGAPSNHGVTVDTATGAITLTPAPAPTPTLHNFLLEVEVSHSNPAVPSPARSGFRIHVHDEIVGMLLTPDLLVARQDATSVRITVLGLFSDLTMGEITDWSVFHTGAVDPVTGDPLHLVQLRSNDPGTSTLSTDIVVEPVLQTIRFLTAGASAEIVAEFLGTAVPLTVLARCDPPWSTPAEAVLVSGPGEDRRDEFSNVLFLPDGFAATEQAAFESLVQDLVTNGRNGMARNAFLSPFNHLRDSINYWSCFVPSERTGVSILSEVCRLRGTGATRRGLAMPPPSRPSTAATEWTIEEMIHEVGLPVPAQAALGRAALVADWQALYGAHVTDARVSAPLAVGGGPAEMWQAWQVLSDRVLCRDISTAFGVAVGGRRSAHCGGSVPRQLVPDDKRLRNDDLDAFLRNLEFRDPATGTLTAFGDHWAPGIQGVSDAGKDHELVCILARTPYRAGTNSNVICVGLAEEREHVVSAPPGAPEPIPMTIPSSANLDTIVTVAHEVAHSFGCDDEYAGDCAAGPPRDTAWSGNTQLDAEDGLLVGGALDAAKIKWLLPRIDKAGILRAKPTPDPADAKFLTLDLRPGHSTFAVGDVLRLRAWPVATNRTASVRLQVGTVTRDAVNGDTLRVEQIEGLPVFVNPDDFPAWSNVLRPVVPPGTPLGDDVLLVHPDIVTHIDSTTGTGGPLNAPLGSPTRDCPADFASNPEPHLYQIQMATNLPASLRHGTRTRPIWGSWIAGLYEGGAGSPCGIFHPTGACLMRSFAVPRETLSGAAIVAGFDTHGRRIPPPGTLYRFCPVCRYLIVDSVDANKHPQIEAEYRPHYPA